MIPAAPPADLVAFLRGIWADRRDEARRRAFADWSADRYPPADPDPVPPLPGGELFRRHWRYQTAWIMDDVRAIPTDAEVSRAVRRIEGGVAGKQFRRSARYRPFGHPGRVSVGGIDCLVGDSALPLDQACQAAENVQGYLSLPVTVALDPRPGTDLTVRLQVWLWPAGSGPSYWPGNVDPSPPRPRTRPQRRSPGRAVPTLAH